MVEFLSIVIPHYRRIKYLKNLLTSIHMYANFPFEVIVHDDNAITELTNDLGYITSTIIHNYGLNRGLAESSNMAVSVAGSEYILFLNEDTEIISQCFEQIVNILKKPYVGYITGYGEGELTQEKCFDSNGTKFFVNGGVGACCIMAFRKTTFNEIGGFELVDSARCDTTLAYKMWRQGYFRAIPRGKFPIRNVSLEDKRNIDTTIIVTGKKMHIPEMHYPKLFNISKHDYYSKCNKQFDYRRVYGWQEEVREEGIANLNYWHSFTTKLVPNPCFINWNYNKYGHDKWKEAIVADMQQ